jgi:hypothetical protein
MAYPVCCLWALHTAGMLAAERTLETPDAASPGEGEKRREWGNDADGVNGNGLGSHPVGRLGFGSLPRGRTGSSPRRTVRPDGGGGVGGGGGGADPVRLPPPAPPLLPAPSPPRLGMKHQRRRRASVSAMDEVGPGTYPKP